MRRGCSPRAACGVQTTWYAGSKPLILFVGQALMDQSLLRLMALERRATVSADVVYPILNQKSAWWRGTDL